MALRIVVRFSRSWKTDFEEKFNVKLSDLRNTIVDSDAEIRTHAGGYCIDHIAENDAFFARYGRFAYSVRRFSRATACFIVLCFIAVIYTARLCTDS